MIFVGLSVCVCARVCVVTFMCILSVFNARDYSNSNNRIQRFTGNPRSRSQREECAEHLQMQVGVRTAALQTGERSLSLPLSADGVR